MLYGLFYCCESVLEGPVQSEVYCLTCKNKMEEIGFIEDAKNRKSKVDRPIRAGT